MKLYPDLYFVIQEYGRYLRHTHNLEKSKEMLEKAVQLNDTTFSRHHLALTLKKMVGKDTPVLQNIFNIHILKMREISLIMPTVVVMN